MRVDMRDVHSLEQDANFTRVLTDMIGAAVFWEGRLCVARFALSLSSRLVSCGSDGSAEAETDAPGSQPPVVGAALCDRHDGEQYIDRSGG